MRKSLRHPSIRPSHPAEIILDSLPALGMTKVELAKALGISRNTLYNLLDQKQGVTAAMAVRLESVLGSSAEMWLGIQSSHDLWKVRQAAGGKNARRPPGRPSHATMPFRQ
jgi:addiction module HigA family antidote